MDNETGKHGLGGLQLTMTKNADYQAGYDAQIVTNSCIDFMKTMPDEVVRLLVSSPPYNIGKGAEKEVALSDYLDAQLLILRDCARVLAPNGSLCWQTGNFIKSGEIFPLDIYFYQLIKEQLGLQLRSRIIWSFEHGLHTQRRLSGRYEVILWFTKGNDYIFNLDPIRIPQKYPGKRHYKGPNKGKISGNPNGKNPGDVWHFPGVEWESGIWELPNVKAQHPEKTDHPSQFPIELVERLVLALTNPSDLILDPFVGAGASLIAALLHGRRAIGVDIDPAYTAITLNRFNDLVNGTLKRRVLGTSIYQPIGKEKVARRPPEWDELQK